MRKISGKSAPRKAGLLGSIRYRIIVSVVLLILCMQITSSAIQAYQIRSIFIREFTQSATNYAQSIFLTLDRMVTAGLSLNLDYDKKPVQELVDIYMQIIQFERFIPTSNYKDNLFSIQFINNVNRAVTRITSDEGGVHQSFIARGDSIPLNEEFIQMSLSRKVDSLIYNGFVHVVVPYFFNDVFYGSLILSYSNTSLKRAISHAFITAAFMVPIYMILVTPIVFVFITRILTRPLRKITRLMSKLAAGDLNQWYEIDRLDEIGEVGESVNDLTHSLKYTFDKMRKALISTDAVFISDVASSQNPDDVLALIQGMGRAESELRCLSRKLIETIEEERKKVASDLHDSIGQVLTTLQFDLNLIEDSISDSDTNLNQICTNAMQKTKELGRVIRLTCARLRPTVLDDLGLVPAIRAQLNELSNLGKFNVSMSLVGEEKRFDPRAELTLYRVVQESLNNIKKHSDAEIVRIIIEFHDNIVFLSIEDDGVGFSLSNHDHRTMKENEGIGLFSMNERVIAQGGEIAITSAVNEGTKISVRIPIEGYFP